MSKPIEDYGIIGNMISAALVSRDGSIDWLCLPRFDSAACFAALLGGPKHGRWLLTPADPACRISRRYVPGTAVLETRFETATGVCTLTDFMPLTDDEEKVDVVRIVRGVSGEVAMSMELILRFNYGQAVPWVRRRDYGLSAVAGPDAVELHTAVALEGRDMTSTARFTARQNEEVPFTLSYHRSHKMPHFVPDRSETMDRTISWWQEWSKRCRFDIKHHVWRDAVIRSLITLKLLTFGPTGGIVAAPTTSLPEAIGGSRNWDYRYCWLRDSALTLYALLNAGYREEAEAWRQWLLRAAAGRPEQLHIMYGIAGERWLPENEVTWLPGYEESSPVRIGNEAVGQMQLDVYGELIETLHAAREAELAPLAEAWRLQNVLLDHLETVWRKPDNGIWEVRGEPRAFTHSRLMCWVAFDRAIKSAEHFGLEGPVDGWRETRDTIHADICENGFDPNRNSFTQHYGGKALDASLLLIPQVGFLPADDPRVVGTITAIEQDLISNGFVLRYSTDQVDDGIGGEEGAFLACSFWLADAYVMLGRIDDASKLFESLLAVRNDLGLLAEEYDPIRRRLVGNFPQGFSHIGLINTAFNLIDASGPAQQRSQRVAPTGGKTR
ncbi:GH15 family glucan-1,4-alpha-glucosidase [Nitrobacter vulgaris]|uniref:glycoside hydrolase family 15 protein n=1 Tax=Nitrobacter vulgaris TaxID=29421 RepID=UPI00285A0CE4|nr:glycoside hydrolase family 15 protein [Nitrobacter vulgaris]MDR6306053.1 GH15 family glucan-1,4-alpha-glucosidase [Nitrobacter vulgaris]